MASLAPEVSVILCTRNRLEAVSQSLPLLLVAARSASARTEVLVIDNGGQRRELQEIIDKFQHPEQEVRLLSAATPGLSRARSVGAFFARGGVLAYVDDDVHVPTTWVDQMAVPILRGEADAVAGRVVLAPYLQEIPWLSPFFKQ